jgi:hypothetical protein
MKNPTLPVKTRILFVITLLCAAITSAQIVHAATIIVMNANDSGPGSLRQALADANDGDTVNFDSSLNGQTITLASGQLSVNDSVTISGPGADILAVSGNHASRVFYIGFGKTVTISGLTITNGTINGNGGGIYNDHATLTVSNSTLSGNSATTDGGGIFNYAIHGSATLTITNSTLSGNSASSGGGGIFNYGAFGNATLEVLNSTLSGNSAAAGGGLSNLGDFGSGMLEVLNSTLSGNSASLGGGIRNHNVGNGSATVGIGDTILKTGALGANIYNDQGMVTSLGYNLSNDGGGGFLTATGDQINTNPMLGSLQDNGGPTFTHALLSDSPAINMGDPSFTPPPDYDQRGPGYPRVANGRIDIGAFEVQPAYAAQIQQPINADGTSVFNVRRGVVPVKFTLTLDGVPTCDLPPATIAVTRTAGGTTGPIDESVYVGPADTGSNFRIDSCQYIYNLSASALGAGTYEVDILINGQVVGSATFTLR